MGSSKPEDKLDFLEAGEPDIGASVHLGFSEGVEYRRRRELRGLDELSDEASCETFGEDDYESDNGEETPGRISSRRKFKLKISRLKWFFTSKRARGRLEKSHSALFPSSSPRRFSFRRLSRSSFYSRRKRNKYIANSHNSGVDLGVTKIDPQSKLNFSSILLNSIYISEDTTKTQMGDFDGRYYFDENFPAEEKFKSLFEIFPMDSELLESSATSGEPVNETETEGRQGVEKPFQHPDYSFGNANIRALLESKGSTKQKKARKEDSLRFKFEELESSRLALGKHLKSMRIHHDSIQLYDMRIANKEHQGQLKSMRKEMFMRLAGKLSEVSFECLLSNPNENSCQLVYNKDGVRVWKSEHKSGKVLLRTEFIVPVTPLDYVEYSTDGNNRRVYDNNTVDLKVLERISSGLEVMYVATKRIATVYPRDIVNIRFLHGIDTRNEMKLLSWDDLRNPKVKERQEEIICCSCSCSIEHPDAPEREGYVRMDLAIGSYMAIPIKTPFGVWSSISMFNEANPKGWIPSSVTKMIAAKMVPGSVESIISSMFNHYKLPFRNKINRPYSGFCHRALTNIYLDHRKLEALDQGLTREERKITDGKSSGVGSSGQKNAKFHLKLSFLPNQPLLISIQDFIATYKSNSVQEFIDHFNSIHIISRLANPLCASQSDSDLLSSSTNASRNVNSDFDNSGCIKFNNNNIIQLIRKQESRLSVYNFSIEKVPKSGVSKRDQQLNHQIKMNTIKASEDHLNSSERPCSFEFCESFHSITNKENQNAKATISCSKKLLLSGKGDCPFHKRLNRLFLKVTKLYEVYDALHLIEFSDLDSLTQTTSRLI
ncbi:START domain-containing protein [Cryptosporidium felis]|nr:START domain-containing protein [Cryptosporidium felis]